VRATWPFASLTVAGDRLTLRLPLVGSYPFGTGDVVALEPSGRLPYLDRGVRIVHGVHDYPEEIVFWCIGPPQSLIEEIRAHGFEPRAPAEAAAERLGMAVRLSTVVILILGWLALVEASHSLRLEARALADASVLAALLIGTVAFERSSRIQAWALRPGRSIGELRPLLRLLRFVTAVLLVAFLGVAIASG
jgi:hypothetical protein